MSPSPTTGRALQRWPISARRRCRRRTASRSISDDFESLDPPDPANRHAVYHAVDLNFRLKPTSKAVDAGVLIPTVNDGFTGRAPDLGALEVGKPEPQYGPRWLKGQPFYR